MNAKRVNAAAGVIHGSQVRGKRWRRELRATVRQRTELLRIVQEKARKLRLEADGRAAHGDRLWSENEVLRARVAELEAELAGVTAKAAEADGITRRIAPTQALREDPHDSPLHHGYRLGRDLPQPDAAP